MTTHPSAAPQAGDDPAAQHLALHSRYLESQLQVAEALLAITDSRQRASSRATIVKAYKTVRGSAVKHVKAALPALGTVVQKYMG